QPLRRDKPTWTGRSPRWACADYEYIHISESRVRWQCLFEWDVKEERFRITTGPVASVWINAEDVGGVKRRLLHEGDVVIISGVKRGPSCVGLTLVRCGPEDAVTDPEREEEGDECGLNLHGDSP